MKSPLEPDVLTPRRLTSSFFPNGRIEKNAFSPSTPGFGQWSRSPGFELDQSPDPEERQTEWSAGFSRNSVDDDFSPPVSAGFYTNQNRKNEELSGRADVFQWPTVDNDVFSISPFLPTPPSRQGRREFETGCPASFFRFSGDDDNVFQEFSPTPVQSFSSWAEFERNLREIREIGRSTSKCYIPSASDDVSLVFSPSPIPSPLLSGVEFDQKCQEGRAICRTTSEYSPSMCDDVFFPSLSVSVHPEVSTKDRYRDESGTGSYVQENDDTFHQAPMESICTSSGDVYRPIPVVTPGREIQAERGKLLKFLIAWRSHTLQCRLPA